MRMKIALATIGLLTAIAMVAQEPAKKKRDAATYDIREATGPIRVDGSLSEDAWKNATPIPLAFEWHPGDNVAPPVKTDLLLTFDRQNLYVAFRAYDPK